MTELQNETLPDDRGITPVGTGDNGRTAMLKRGFGALALAAFAFLIIWGTWKGDKPVSDSARKLMIRRPSRSPRSRRRQQYLFPHRTNCWRVRVARQYWPITGRCHLDIPLATA